VTRPKIQKKNQIHVANVLLGDRDQSDFMGFANLSHKGTLFANAIPEIV